MSAVAWHVEPSVQLARRLRHRREIDRLDYLRTVRALVATMRQEELARTLGVTQPAISAALKSARSVPDVPAGFSGASPYEIAERYAAGQIDRDQVVEELVSFPYVASPSSDGVDWLVEEVANTTADVRRAWEDGLIEESDYVDIAEGIVERRRAAAL